MADPDNFSHAATVFPVKNVEQSVAFYSKKLGFTVTFTWEEPMSYAVLKKGSVSIIRKRQFVLIKPATKTRIDLGFKLKDKATTDRLGNSGPFGTMCTHRVKLSETKEVDQELKNWIKEAYEKSV